MKTLEQLKELTSKCLDGRDFNRLAKFVPYSMIKDFGMEPNEEYDNEEKWNSTVVEFTRENVLKQLEEDVRFGFEKALNQNGTSRLDALNTQPFGFSVYAKPFLKRVIEYGNGETKVEYGRLNTEKGTYAHWLNCVTSISYNRHKQVMEVECNECTSKLFVDMIKSICNISEQVKSFVNPEQIKAIAESNEPILLLSNN